MKKYFLLLMVSAYISVANAQLVKQNEQGEKNKLIWIGIIVLLIKMECMEQR